MTEIRETVDGRRMFPQKEMVLESATIRTPKEIVIQETSIPHLRPREVLVRLEGCGVCHSDFPVWEGRPWFSYPREPGSPGHEAWGTVEGVYDQSQEHLRGKRVAILSSHGYARYDIVPDTHIVVLPESLAGKPFPGEPLGCAMNIARRSGIEAGCKVAVIGVGFLGALLCQLSVGAGAETLAVSRRPSALAFAARTGAAVIDTGRDDAIISKTNAMTRNEGFDVVVEATGMQWALDLAGRMVRVRGRLVIAGYHQDGLRTIDMQEWNWRGIDVINSHERDDRLYIQGIRDAVDAILGGKINPFPLLTHRAGLEAMGSLFDLMEHRPEGFLKGYVAL